MVHELYKTGMGETSFEKVIQTPSFFDFYSSQGDGYEYTSTTIAVVRVNVVVTINFVVLLLAAVLTSECPSYASSHGTKLPIASLACTALSCFVCLIYYIFYYHKIVDSTCCFFVLNFCFLQTVLGISFSPLFLVLAPRVGERGWGMGDLAFSSCQI